MDRPTSAHCLEGAQACVWRTSSAVAAGVAWNHMTLARVALTLIAVGGLAGCRHKTMPLVLPQVSMVPIDLEVPPEPENPPMIEAPPQAAVVVPPLPPPPLPKKVVKKKPTPAKETPPVQIVSSEPAALAIGALSSGGDSTPQGQQQTREMIASIRKRLAALPGETASQQKEEVSQVGRFLRQAQQALDSGDADGAKNLATKARLLMDDIEKK
jgi:outer membrane biosynthesis protein TonB